MQTDIATLALLVKERIGIDMLSNTESLKRKITPRLTKLNLSVWGYIQHIKQHEEEWEEIIDCVTINETYFFREKEQLEEFKKIVSKIGQKHIRIWSAACSTGEEPYTLAMMAKDVLPPDVTVEIIATDINQDVVDFAKKGVYSKNSLSFRRMSSEKIDKYFDLIDGNYHIKEVYKNMVTFSTFNLIQKNKWFMMKNFDIIFCRNVLIYFDEEDTKGIIERFYHSLGDKGVLFLGHSDPYRQIYEEFDFVRTAKTLYLTKGEQL